MNEFQQKVNLLEKMKMEKKKDAKQFKNSLAAVKKGQTHLFETEGGFAQNLTQDNSQSEASIPSGPRDRSPWNQTFEESYEKHYSWILFGEQGEWSRRYNKVMQIY